MPAFSYYFGIHPWQVADLTFGEVEDYMSAIKQLQKKQGGRAGG